MKDGQRTEFTYDGQSRWTRIVEKDGPLASAPLTGDRRFVWEGFRIAQIRDYDASGTLTGVRHIFAEGEIRTASLAQDLSTGTSLLHLPDHLGSVREVVNTADLAARARYDFDPYGQRTKLGGDLDSDFGFTGHYEHAPSGLTLAPFRAYHSGLGRWLSRDPIEEEGGLNLYGYVENRPSFYVDLTGLAPRNDLIAKYANNPNMTVAEKTASIARDIYAEKASLRSSKQSRGNGHKVYAAFSTDMADTFVSGKALSPGNGPATFAALGGGSICPSGFKSEFTANETDFGRHLGAAFQWPQLSIGFWGGDALQSATATTNARRSESKAESKMDWQFSEFANSVARGSSTGGYSAGNVYRDLLKTLTGK